MDIFYTGERMTPPVIHASEGLDQDSFYSALCSRRPCTLGIPLARRRCPNEIKVPYRHRKRVDVRLHEIKRVIPARFYVHANNFFEACVVETDRSTATATVKIKSFHLVPRKQGKPLGKKQIPFVGFNIFLTLIVKPLPVVEFSHGSPPIDG